MAGGWVSRRRRDWSSGRRGLVLNPKQETFSFTCGAQVCPDRLTKLFPVVSAPRGNTQEEEGRILTTAKPFYASLRRLMAHISKTSVSDLCL